jgi:hypothetical protein
LGLLFAAYRVLVWTGVGALAVAWLRGKGSTERSKQIQAGVLAGLITGLATGTFLVIFALIQSRPIDPLLLPEGVTPELVEQVGAAFAICCYGLPTALVGTGFSVGGALLARFFLGEAAPAPPRPSAGRPRALKLDDYLARRELSEELKPAIDAFYRGEKGRSRSMLGAILRQDPRNWQAWLWMATLMEDPARQKECVQRALAINPGNTTAREMMSAIERAEGAGM